MNPYPHLTDDALIALVAVVAHTGGPTNDLLNVLHELIELRHVIAEWKDEADKISEMGEEAINGWQEMNSFSWYLVQMVHSCNLRYGG